MSKLSIGVYGDSFANMNLDKPGSYSWIDQLNTQHDVTNYGQCGNSVFQCYKDYQDHSAKHDYNIFVVPTLQRIYSNRLQHLLDGVHGFNNWYINIPSIEFAEQVVKRDDNSSDKLYKLKIMESVKFAMVEWVDHEYLTETNLAIVDRIRNHSKLLLLDTNTSPGKVSLTDISLRELYDVGYKEEYLDKGWHLNHVDMENKRASQDDRCNHLSEENNLILGNMILSAIDNNVTGELSLSYDQFLKPSKPLSHYLKWIGL